MKLEFIYYSENGEIQTLTNTTTRFQNMQKQETQTYSAKLVDGKKAVRQVSSGAVKVSSIKHNKK